MTRASRFLAALSATLPPERLQHGRLTRSERQIADAQGGIGRPYVAEGLLAMLERRGDISHHQLIAGELFAQLFRLAALDPLRATDFDQRVDAGPARTASFVEYARSRINLALDALGGIGSPAGSCAWHILGLENSIADWAQREGWSGRPLRPEVAKGTLIATLGVLAAHFRLRPRNAD